MQSAGLIPKDYRYKCKGDANMTPLIIGDSAQPERFPTLCNCNKFTREKLVFIVFEK